MTPDAKSLSKQGLRLMQHLLDLMQRGIVRAGVPRTYPSYGDVHSALRLEQIGQKYGQSLGVQGMSDLAEWAKDLGYPAITGLIISRDNQQPGGDYFRLHGLEPEGEKAQRWWQIQIEASFAFDWCAVLPLKDETPVKVADLDLAEEESVSEGAPRTNTSVERERSRKLLKAAIDYWTRKQNGVLTCLVCQWSRPPIPAIERIVIEMHHTHPLREYKDGGETLKLKDALARLVPLCPTCHRLAHAKPDGIFTVEELKPFIGRK